LEQLSNVYQPTLPIVAVSGQAQMNIEPEASEARVPFGMGTPAAKAFGSVVRTALPKVGLEPTPTCVDRILNPARLPFRHFGGGICQ
jgi:hypothetical protein